MTAENEIDRIMPDQSLLIARMLESIAQLGEVQKVVARSLIDLHMHAECKVVVSANLASAINALNRASHLIMRENVKAAKDALDHDALIQH